MHRNNAHALVVCSTDSLEHQRQDRRCLQQGEASAGHARNLSHATAVVSAPVGFNGSIIGFSAWKCSIVLNKIKKYASRAYNFCAP